MSVLSSFVMQWILGCKVLSHTKVSLFLIRISRVGLLGHMIDDISVLWALTTLTLWLYYLHSHQQQSRISFPTSSPAGVINRSLYADSFQLSWKEAQHGFFFIVFPLLLRWLSIFSYVCHPFWFVPLKTVCSFPWSFSSLAYLFWYFSEALHISWIVSPFVVQCINIFLPSCWLPLCSVYHCLYYT